MRNENHKNVAKIDFRSKLQSNQYMLPIVKKLVLDEQNQWLASGLYCDLLSFRLVDKVLRLFAAFVEYICGID